MTNNSRRISRRDFLRLSGVAAAGAFLASCRQSPLSRVSNDNGPVQLVYQDWRTEWFPGLAQEMLAEFHQTHPNIRVFYTPDPENLEETMLADMEAGTAADVFSGCCDFYPVFAQKGYRQRLRIGQKPNIRHWPCQEGIALRCQSIMALLPYTTTKICSIKQV
jgi:ABC-type glycerol-3-phosphate transport system substrate-binding protein